MGFVRGTAAASPVMGVGPRLARPRAGTRARPDVRPRIGKPDTPAVRRTRQESKSLTVARTSYPVTVADPSAFTFSVAGCGDFCQEFLPSIPSGVARKLQQEDRIPITMAVILRDSIFPSG
jgi:hypothetical protein